MTKFCINSTIVERLREQDLNATDLLQKYAKKHKKQTAKIIEELEEDILRTVSKLNRSIEESGINNEELIKILEEAGIVIKR